MKELIIIGAGGFAKSVIDSVKLSEYRIVGFLDDYKEEKEHLGYPILGRGLDELDNREQYCYFIAIGNNQKRRNWYEQLMKHNLAVINVVDPSAIVSKHAVLGEGCFVGKFAVVNSNATIGDNCVINTRALVEHGCIIHDHVNISTNTVLNGDVIVGEETFVGSSSVINGQIKIGKKVMVGAGSVVIKEIPDGATAVGVPAKVIKIDGVRV